MTTREVQSRSLERMPMRSKLEVFMDLLRIVLSPVKCFKYVKQKEQTLMLCLSCMHKGLDEPTVWEVDILHDDVNEMFAILHEDPKLLDKFKFKHDMFWHLFLSRFMKLEVSREDVQNFVKTCTKLKSSMQLAGAELFGVEKKIMPVDLFIAWKKVMKDAILSR